MKQLLMFASLVLVAAGCHGNGPDQQVGRTAVDADQRYLQQVADRDQDMIALATVAESKGSSEHIRTMAHNAISKQQTELHQVEDWLKVWYGTSDAPHMTAEGSQQLEHLKTVGGKEFDREYLTGMIHAYQANVDGSRPVSESSSRPQLRDFAQQLIKEQSHQASHLKEHLAEVSGGPDHDAHGDDHAHDHESH
jgi:uncharacterized protein (DUF305 family)